MKEKVVNNKICQTHSERIKEKLRTKYTECNKKVKTATCKNKMDFMEDLAREAESAASNQRMGQIYQVTKQLSGRKAQVSMPIKDKNNNMLTTEQEQYSRWKEHVQEVLSRKDPEAPMDLEIDTDPPSTLEIQKAIKSLKNKKAPGTDQLNIELFKIDPVVAVNMLHPVFHKIWEKAVIPNSWSEDNIIRIPKSGDLTNCKTKLEWNHLTIHSEQGLQHSLYIKNYRSCGQETTTRTSFVQKR
jgi:hypothetical protein